MNLSDPVQLEIFYRVLYALAGAAGGAIRWWSARSPLRVGLGHLAAGAIAGTFFHGLVFAALKPLADLSGLSELDGKLLGAHLAGVLGLTLYAVIPDLIAAWFRAKASTPTEPTP